MGFASGAFLSSRPYFAPSGFGVPPGSLQEKATSGRVSVGEGGGGWLQPGWMLFLDGMPLSARPFLGPAGQNMCKKKGPGNSRGTRGVEPDAGKQLEVRCLGESSLYPCVACGWLGVFPDLLGLVPGITF